MMGKTLLIAYEDVLCDAQSINGAGFLHDHGDSTFSGIPGILRAVWLPIQEHFAARHSVNCTDHGGYGGFTGTVLSDQSADLSGPDRHAYVIDCRDVSEFLGQIFCFKKYFILLLFHTEVSPPMFLPDL